jgi:hypothetical protein
MRYTVDKKFYFYNTNSPIGVLECRPGEVFTIINEDDKVYSCKFDEAGGKEDYIINQPALTWRIPKESIDKNCSAIEKLWEL